MNLRKVHADVWIGSLLIILAVYFYVLAGSFRNPDAAIWPKCVLIVIALLSTLLVIRGIRLTTRGADTEMIPSSLLKGPMVSILLIIAYAILMNFVGYFISTAIFLPLGMFALGQRNWKIMLGITIGLELFIYILFDVELKIRMP